MRHEVRHCSAETSSGSGVGTWYQLRNEYFISVFLGIEAVFMTTRYVCSSVSSPDVGTAIVRPLLPHFFIDHEGFIGQYCGHVYG